MVSSLFFFLLFLLKARPDFTNSHNNISSSAASKIGSSMISHGFLSGGSTTLEARQRYAVSNVCLKWGSRCFNVFLPSPVRKVDAVTLCVQLATWTGELQDAFVDSSGNFAVARLKKSKLWVKLQTGLAQLQWVDWKSLGKNEQRVFFINLYLVLSFLLRVHYGLPTSEKGRERFFETMGLLVGDEVCTLDWIDCIQPLRVTWVGNSPHGAFSWTEIQGDPRVHWAVARVLDRSAPVAIATLSGLDYMLDYLSFIYVDYAVKIVQGDATTVVLANFFRQNMDAFAPSKESLVAWLSKYHVGLSSLGPMSAQSVTFDGGLYSGRLLEMERTSSGGPAAVPQASPRPMLRNASVDAFSAPKPAQEIVVCVGADELLVARDAATTVWDLKIALTRLFAASNSSHANLLPFDMTLSSPVAVLSDNAARLDACGVVGPETKLLLQTRSDSKKPELAHANSVFGLQSKKSLLHAACFAFGRGVHHAAVGEKAEFSVCFVDASFCAMGLTPSFLKSVDVRISQGKRPLDVVLSSTHTLLNVSFCPVSPSVAGDSYRCSVLVGGKEVCGGPMAGKIIDLSNVQEALRAHCHNTEFGVELAQACARLTDPLLDVGFALIIDLVLANKNTQHRQTLAPLLPKIARFLNWSEFFASCKEDGVLAVAILGSLGDADLASAAGKALFSMLSRCVESYDAVLPSLEVCEEVMLALCSSQRMLLAAGLYSVMVKIPLLESFVVSQLFQRIWFVKLFAASQLDAVSLVLSSTNKLYARKPFILSNSDPMIPLLVGNVRMPLLAIRRDALALLLRVMDEGNARRCFQEGLHEAIREALLEEQSLNTDVLQVTAFGQVGNMDFYQSENVVALLSCLEKFFSLLGGLESESLRGLAVLGTGGRNVSVLQGLFVSLVHMSSSSVNVDIVRRAWRCLIVVVMLQDRKGVGVAGVFWNHLSDSLVSLLDAGHLDLCGIPFSDLCGLTVSEPFRLGCVKAMAKVVLMGKQWHKSVVLALGGGFLHSYVALISSGALEPQHVLVDDKDLVLGKKLGTGASGTVFLASYRGQHVAVKTISDESISFNLKEFLSELALMNIVRHRNIVHLVCASLKAGAYFLASKFYSRGALDVVLKTAEITLEREISWALQIARAMKYLHALSVMHRDL